MATCGYLCPQCEGRGFTEDGNSCDWCSAPIYNKEENKLNTNPTDDEWLEKVHNGPCCGDLGLAGEIEKE